MWLLTSRGRPDRLRAVADGYFWGSESRVHLVLWEGDPRLHEYIHQQWPASWRIDTVPMEGNGPTYNEMLRRHPAEKCYGFLADDALLGVQGMLHDMERAAGAWDIAYSNDQHHGPDLPTMPCIGGDLARAVGYLAPPMLMHWAIDNVWGEIGRKLDCLRYMERLTYTHNNPVWGTAKDDATYKKARQNSFGWDSVLRAWTINELPKAVQRVRAAQAKAA